MDPMFEVDPAGLAAVMGRRGYGWVGHELLQNSLDTHARRIDVTVEPVPGRKRVLLVVSDDDPEGFGERLHHAWTLFAPSHKRDQAQLRGRWNVGEKYVLARCEEASIHTTSGTVIFKDGGRRRYPRRKRAQGTEVRCLLEITHADGDEILGALRAVLIPEGVQVTVNGRALTYQPPLAEFEVTLPTEIAGDDGRMRRTRRKTTVRIVQPAGGAQPMLMELGIPVVEAPPGCPWHVDVQQKVLLGVERDNVTPGYRRELSAAVLNHTAGLLNAEQSSETWIDEAIEHPAVQPETVAEIITRRFGDNAVVFDPSDREANHLAVTRGFTVVPPRAFSRDAWKHVRGSGVLRPAGQVTPSPKPFHPDGRPLRTIAPEQASSQARQVAGYYAQIGARLLNAPLRIVLTDDRGWKFRAACGPDRILYLSVILQPAGFWQSPRQWDELLIHELAHIREANHLSSRFYDELCRLGAALVQIAIDDPELVSRLRSSDPHPAAV